MTHLYIPFALGDPLVDLLEGEHLDVHQDDGHRLVLVVPIVSEGHSPDPVPDIGHLIKVELEESKVLVQSNTPLHTISPEEGKAII